MIKPATATSNQINDFSRRINNLLDEKQTVSGDVASVYDEAKRAGVNTKALRKVIAKRRAKTPDPAVEAAMEAYEHALDEAASMVSNGSTSLRKAATASGFSKSAIQRRVSHRNENAGSGTNTDIEDAALGACVDGPSVSSVAETIVPRPATPQSDEVPALSDTPSPDSRGRDGTIGLTIPKRLDRRAVNG